MRKSKAIMNFEREQNQIKHKKEIHNEEIQGFYKDPFLSHLVTLLFYGVVYEHNECAIKKFLKIPRQKEFHNQ